MKVAYLLGSLNRGGTETLLLDVFKNVSKVNFDFIAIHRKTGFLQADFYATGVTFFHLSPKFPFDIFYFCKLRKLLKREKINIIHAQQSLDAVYARIACLGTKIKIVQTLHCYDNLTDKKNKLMLLTLKLTDKNIFVSNFQREYYTKKYNLKPEKQVTVYNGISFNKFDYKCNTPDFLQNSSPSANLKMAMVGNFVRGREQSSVCKFLKLLHDRDVVFNFYFIGKKNEAEPWRYDDCVQYCKNNGLSDCVHFLGSRSDVPTILQNIDVFIYSTDHDTFGIAVIEAIAARLPVFVNDWGVMKEITNSGEWATLYKTKDEQDLLEKFLVFLQHKDKYQLKTQKAAKKVREKFSIEKHISELSKVYDDL